jgi:hypothetical protein
VVDEQQYFLEHLNQVGTRLDELESSKAAGYLYDLSAEGPDGPGTGKSVDEADYTPARVLFNTPLSHFGLTQPTTYVCSTPTRHF